MERKRIDEKITRDEVKNETLRESEARMKDSEIRVPVVEEELRVGKQQVETGGVQVKSRVEERPVNEQVNLREEHVNVERHAVDRAVNPADMKAFEEKTFELRETAERPVVAKEARVVEEVVVGKNVTNRTETISDTVRRTDVEVMPVMKSYARTGYETFNDDFRTHYNRSFANSGLPFSHYDHAYRYGYELAGDDRVKGKDWNVVERDARETWETHNKGTWERFKDAVRYGWDRSRS